MSYNDLQQFCHFYDTRIPNITSASLIRESDFLSQWRKLFTPRIYLPFSMSNLAYFEGPVDDIAKAKKIYASILNWKD
jgi:hypothetical protein